PIRRDVSGQVGFETTNSVAARQDEKSGVVRVGERNVRAIKLVNRGSVQKPRQHVPFDADLLVLELLRIENNGAVIQRTELVARGRQIRDAVGAVNGQIIDR